MSIGFQNDQKGIQLIGRPYIRKLSHDHTPVEPPAEPPYSPCKPASPKRSYKDLFSSSDRTYTTA